MPMNKTLMKVIGIVHVSLYKVSGGKLTRNMRGSEVVLLTTTGRQSGHNAARPQRLHARDQLRANVLSDRLAVDNLCCHAVFDGSMRDGRKRGKGRAAVRSSYNGTASAR